MNNPFPPKVGLIGPWSGHVKTESSEWFRSNEGSQGRF